MWFGRALVKFNVAGLPIYIDYQLKTIVYITKFYCYLPAAWHYNDRLITSLEYHFTRLTKYGLTKTYIDI
jgi:hypothetical protein